MNAIDNYDTCSTVPDCELRCYYDTATSYIDFEDNFSPLMLGNCDNIHLYNPDGSLDIPSDVNDCLDWDSVSEKDACQYVSRTLKEKHNWDNLQIIREKEFFDLDWKEYAVECIRDSWGDYEYDESGFLLNCIKEDEWPDIAPALYESVGISGHCQGDYAYVLYKPEEEGVLSDRSTARDLFSNLFYDSPVYCRLEVDGDEYSLEEGLKDIYRWNQEEVLEYAKTTLKLPESVIDWLTENLPDEPDFE